MLPSVFAQPRLPPIDIGLSPDFNQQVVGEACIGKVNNINSSYRHVLGAYIIFLYLVKQKARCGGAMSHVQLTSKVASGKPSGLRFLPAVWPFLWSNRLITARC
ncbi:hypothetical protein P3342_005837 [Pyrenophora teres f. teres]|nr:hypothetical protein P3342_005837 [Pyrenophora teres f. teres]